MASRASVRAARYETEFSIQVIDGIFASRSQEECDARLTATVWGAATFQKLPRYRRAYVQGYRDGILDSAARIYGKPISKAPPPPPAIRVPKWVKELDANAHWRRHPHGGGWVAHTAYVESTVYLGAEAAVYEDARVLGSCRVYGKSRVHGRAELYGSVYLRAGADVSGDAQVSGRVRILHVSVNTGQIDGEHVLRTDEDVTRALAGTPAVERASFHPPVRQAPTYIAELAP